MPVSNSIVREDLVWNDSPSLTVGLLPVYNQLEPIALRSGLRGSIFSLCWYNVCTFNIAVTFCMRTKRRVKRCSPQAL